MNILLKINYHIKRYNNECVKHVLGCRRGSNLHNPYIFSSISSYILGYLVLKMQCWNKNDVKNKNNKKVDRLRNNPLRFLRRLINSFRCWSRFSLRIISTTFTVIEMTIVCVTNEVMLRVIIVFVTEICRIIEWNARNSERNRFRSTIICFIISWLKPFSR